MRKLIAITAILVLAVLLTQAAFAEQGQGKGKGQRGEGGEGKRRPPVVFGTLQSISGNSWTIKPQHPPHLKERRKAKGKELPQLPEQITVTVSAATKYYFGGQAASAGSFKAGDQVVVKLEKGGAEGSPNAVAVADPETARQYILEKVRERGTGEGGKRGKGGVEGQGRQGEGRKGPRPMFGTITAVSAGSLTIKPELPDFVVEMLPNKGDKVKGKLPESISVTLNGETRFAVNGAEQSSNPFKVGDKVAIMGAGPKGEMTARRVADYATVKQRMQNKGEKRKNKKAKG